MKAYCFKLYQSKKNRMLRRRIAIAAWIYNHCINLHKRYYRMYGIHLNKYKLQKHIAKLRNRKKYEAWKQLDSQAVQDITDRIDRAYRLFFNNLKRKVRTAPPTFKKSAKYKSFTMKQSGYKLLGGNRIRIGDKTYRFFKSREIEGKVKTVTVKRDAVGDLFIFIVCEKEAVKVMKRTGEMVGYDFGLKTFLKASDGNDIESPGFFMQGASAVKKLNRKLARKENGSNNRKMARLELARTHRRIANRRKDFHFKLGKKLSELYAAICLEDLNVKAMQRLWGRKISDLSHSSFVKILKYQASKVGTEIIEIPRFYPSSKTCSACLHVLDDLPLRVREWQCPICGVVHDRDFNAAKNILRVGASALGRDTVRPAFAG